MSLVFLLPALFTLASADWPVFGGDIAHTGYKDINLLDVNSSSMSVSLLWNITLSTPLTYATISNNFYYTIGSRMNLFILNSTSGETIASKNLGGASYMGPPIIAFNEQIIIQSIGGNEGDFVDSYSLHNNYEKSWEATADAQWAQYPYGTTPSMQQPNNHDNLIYFAAGEYNGEMYAVNANNGSTVFSAGIPTGFGCDYWTPTVYNGRVFMNSQPGEGNSGYLAEIDNKTGSVLWKTELKSDWDGYSTYWLPSISNNMAIITTRSGNNLEVGGLNLSSPSHDVIWGYPCKEPSAFIGSFRDFTASNDGKYAYITCFDGIKSFDLFSGDPMMVYDCNNCSGQPIVTHDVVIVNSGNGIKIFNKQSGVLVKSLDGITGMIALDGNILYTTNSKSGLVTVYSLNATYVPTFDCIWQSLDGQHKLNLSTIKGKTLSMIDENDESLVYALSQCDDLLLCNKQNVMSYLWNITGEECVNYLALWDNGIVEPNHNSNTKQWQFIYENVKNCDGLQEIFQVFWNCDYSKKNTAEMVFAQMVAECTYVMQINSSYACN